jgi:2-dehydro-3-deoxyphosphogluconate aldolase/(4S)-4-hydroxy-2-oxoglutarate aldolase
MNDMDRLIGEVKVVPVVRLDKAEDAVALGKALSEGGLPVAEITFRTDAAEEAIRRLAGEMPDLLVGAGTVLTIDQVRRATGAGAKFIVSPGFNPRVVEFCVGEGIPIYPGINNPMGVEAALDRGLTILKFFPAEASGGVAMLKAMAAPYVGVRYIPTGGVGLANMKSYLSQPFVHAIGGSWLVKGDLISAGRFDEITRLTSEAVAAAKEA